MSIPFSTVCIPHNTVQNYVDKAGITVGITDAAAEGAPRENYTPQSTDARGLFPIGIHGFAPTFFRVTKVMHRLWKDWGITGAKGLIHIERPYPTGGG